MNTFDAVKIVNDFQTKVYNLLYEFCEKQQMSLDEVLVPDFDMHLRPLDELVLDFSQTPVCHLRKKLSTPVANITPDICWVVDREFSTSLPKFQLIFVELHGHIEEINEEFKGTCFFIENICDTLTSEFGLCDLEDLYRSIPSEYQLFVDNLTLPLEPRLHKRGHRLGHTVLFKEGIQFLLHNFLEHPKYTCNNPSAYSFISDILTRICDLLDHTPLL